MFRKVVAAGWLPLSAERVDRRRGAVAQLGARLNGIEEVRGSNPLSSTGVALAGRGDLSSRVVPRRDPSSLRRGVFFLILPKLR